jgi:hypothetical protein
MFLSYDIHMGFFTSIILFSESQDSQKSFSKDEESNPSATEDEESNPSATEKKELNYWLNKYNIKPVIVFESLHIDHSSHVSLLLVRVYRC